MPKTQGDTLGTNDRNNVLHDGDPTLEVMGH